MIKPPTLTEEVVTCAQCGQTHKSESVNYFYVVGAIFVGDKGGIGKQVNVFCMDSKYSLMEDKKIPCFTSWLCEKSGLA